MERWAANTLRTLGIILTSGFVLVTSLLLLLLSVCAVGPSMGGSPGNSREAAGFALVAILVATAGGFFIAWLARGIFRSTRTPEPVSALPGTVPPSDAAAMPVALSLPLHLSPLGQKSVHRLVQALAAQIALSAIALIFNQLHFWSGPRIFAPFPSRNWPLAVFAPFVLYHIPYAVLIYTLLKRPDRRAFTYSLAVPAVLVMQALFSLGYFSLFAVRHPVAMAILFVPWAIHIVIIALAYQAIQQVGLHPKPSSLIVAAIAAFVYFSAIHSVSALLLPYILRRLWL